MIRQLTGFFTSMQRAASILVFGSMLVCLPCLAPKAYGDPVTFYQSFAGNIDFQMTGASLRRQPNHRNACRVVRSRSASLTGIPAGASIRRAYLYWAGSGETADNQVVFQGVATTASRTFSDVFNFNGTDYHFFSGFADVTNQITGNGTYTLSGLTVNRGDPHCSVQAVLSGWSLIVLYDHPAEPFRVINIYDGFRHFRASRIVLNPSNFQIPAAGCSTTGDCKWGVLTWEGDVENSATMNGFSENLFVNGTTMTTPVNPLNNQFNSTIDLLGSAPNPPGNATYGIDIDIYSPLPFSAGDTSASTTYQSGSDLVLLSVEVFSVLNTNVADLSITKSHNGNFTVGQHEDYTIQVQNSGPRDAIGPITVSDNLPAGLAYITGTGNGWSCTAAGQNVTCTHPGPLANGANLPDLTLTLDVGASAPPSVTNTATVSGSTFDNQASNNSASDTATVVQPALSITKTVTTISNPVEGAANAKAIPGAILEYQIVVTNMGTENVDLDSVVIADPLPGNLRLVLNNPIEPVSFSDSGSGLTLNSTDVGNSSSPSYNDVALSNDGGSSFLPLGSINQSAGMDATDPKINFIRINPKGTFMGTAAGGPNPAFTLRFRVQLE